MSSGFSKAFLPLFLVVGCGMIVLLRFGFIFLLLALLPTVVAYYIDRERRRPAFKTVGACNLAATLPTLAPMIRAGIAMKQYDISSVLHDATVWLFVYTGAALGWCLVFLCRFVARFIVTLSYEYNINSLEHTQKRLVEEWGQQIKHPPGT
jgi:cell division protein FtsW (lipid II flippase)